MSEQNHEERFAALEGRVEVLEKRVEGVVETLTGLMQLSKKQIDITGPMNTQAGIISMDLIGLISSVSNDLLAVLKHMACTDRVPEELKQEFLKAIARRESVAERVEHLLAEARAKIANRPPLSGPDGGTEPPA